jgi:signal transduction histidine kinase
MLRDVTDLRRLEAMRRDFVANVSHELKTPLTSIAGYAETLAGEGTLGTQAREFAGTILNNARRMQHLVDDLLDLSRIESGGWRPQRRAVDVKGVARDAWASFADEATRRNLRFDIQVAPDATPLAGDPAALHQILSNLLENAVRHTPDGGRVEVGAEVTSEGLALWVSDTGAGIAAEHLPRIFERFYRVDSGRGRDSGGTGLGLAIVKHLVEAHGARMTARSTPRQGTTIRMVFPPPSAGTEPPPVTEP